jgi:predicted metalloprotease with PDZ domain
MYDEFYLNSPNATYYLRGRGYTTEDFAHVATAVAGSDMSEFFRRYVRGVERLPYDEALAVLGLDLVREPARQPFDAGIGIDREDPENVTINVVRPKSPAEEAGLEEGDEIVSLGRKSITPQNFLVSLSRFKQGDRVPVTVKRNRRTIQTTLILGPPERVEYRIRERTDATLEQKALRTAWLKGA